MTDYFLINQHNQEPKRPRREEKDRKERKNDMKMLGIEVAGVGK